MVKAGPLVICAESGMRTGTGHVMRCLALAQAWKRVGGAVTFLMGAGLPELEERIRAENISVELVSQESNPASTAFTEAALRLRPATVVLDGYGFRESDQLTLSESGVQVLAIDDYVQADNYPARWLLNQNIYADAAMYSRHKSSARLLLGPAYAMLRQEFMPWISWKREIPERAKTILITIGGSDPENLSQKILQSLELLNEANLEVVLVVGAANPHWDVLQKPVEDSSIPIRVVRVAQDMPELMAWADVAVAGAGVTSYELCYFGLPSLLLIVADNQLPIAEGLSRSGAIVNAGRARDFCQRTFAGQLQTLLDSADQRLAMSQRSREIVDGLGSERVRAALLERGLKMRPARVEDSELLFKWASDPVARAVSFRTDAITWQDHTQWFAERLQDSNSIIYIGESMDSGPVGMVRFQTEGDVAVLSVNVAPGFRGKGFGSELIFLSTRILARSRSINKMQAFVRPDNKASVRLFETCGFSLTSNQQIRNQDALVFTWEA